MLLFCSVLQLDHFFEIGVSIKVVQIGVQHLIAEGIVSLYVCT